MLDRQRRLKHKRPRSHTRALRGQAARLTLEPLERRDLLSFSILTTSLPNWTANHSGYNQTINSSGASGAVTSSETGTLPPGLIMVGSTFNTLDDPGALEDPPGDTYAYGISGSEIVGTFYDSGFTAHGFSYNANTGIYTTLDEPSATAGTFADAISGSTIVGFYQDLAGTHGFIYDGSSYASLDVPFGTPGSTTAFGISGSIVVGNFGDSTGTHGFLYNGSTFSTLDDPMAAPGKTFAAGISGNNVVGYYEDASSSFHGFVYDRTTSQFKTLDDPSATQGTYLQGISGSEIVGHFVDSSGQDHGFIYDGSTYTTLDFPGTTVLNTDAYGISGTNIVGSYVTSGPPVTKHGFIYSLMPPTMPPTLSGTPTTPGKYSFSVAETDGAGNSATQAYTVTINPAVAIATTALPAWTAGVSGYNQTLNASGGTGTLTFSSTGTLPPGLTLSSGGVLSGNPSTAGSYSFTATATDTVGASASQNYTVTVNPAVAITTTSLPSGTTSAAYSQTVTATGGTGTVTFSTTAGTLPTGLTLSSSGVLSGTPTATGSFSFTVTATDTLGSTSSQPFHVTINPPPVLTVSPGSLPNGDVGAPYSQTLSATGGTGPYTFAVTSGTLPGGLTLASGGVLSGTPSASGSFSFTIGATDSSSNTGSQPYTITINPAVSLTTTALANWTANQPGYHLTLTASGGTGSFSFSATGTLPAGLTLSSSGVLAGTPSAAASFTFSVTASDSLGGSASKSYTVTINPAVQITTTALPGGTTGTAYSQTLAASGGTGSLSFAISAGTLPGGLTLSSSGVLSGTPSATGSFNFTVTATDSVGASGSAAYTVTIASATPTQLSLSAPSSATAGTSFNVTITAQDSGGHTTTGFSGTVTLASSAGADISPTTVNLSAGTATIPVTLTAAGNQTLTASFTGLNPGTASVTVSPGPLGQYLVGIPGSSTVQAGVNFLVTVQAADNFGNPITSYSGPATVTATVSPASAASNFPTSVSISSTGLGLFLGNLQKVGSYTLTTASGSFTGSAGPVTVTPGSPARLGFVAQPVDTPTGLTLPPVTVQVQDLFGNPITTDNTDTVTVGVGSGPGSLAAGSTASAAVVNGLATFNNLTFIKPGAYTLSAKVPGLYTGPNSASFNVQPLQVLPGSFAGASWGFSLQFNSPFLVNSTTPVLYGQGFGAKAPAPSVTLTQTKDASGIPVNVPVVGSLIVSTATNSITFLATNTTLDGNNGSPILPDGTYTVVLTSTAAANGFQAINSGGGFLDGKHNGTAGSGNYTATFTVNAKAAGDDVLWVPATADGPGQPLVAPGMNQTGGGYPLYIEDSTGTVTSVRVTVNYDPTLLSVTGATANGSLPGSTFTLNTALSSTGKAVFDYGDSGANSGKLKTGQVALGFITAAVPAGTTTSPTAYKAKDLLHLSSPSINGGATLVVTSDGLHVVAFVGDADGNGAYSSNDAVQLTRVGLQTDTGFTAYPLIDPVIVADTDGSGYIPADAALQANEAGVGFTTANLANPPVPPGVHFTPVANNVDPALSLPSTLQVAADGTVTVPVNIDDAHPAGSTGLIAAHLALTYDPRAFIVSAADIHLGSVLAAGSGWTLTATVEPISGQIAIVLSSTTPITSTLGGSLVTIDFHQLGEPGASAVELVASVAPNGQYVATELEDAQGTFTLTPAPTNSVDPHLASQITLAALSAPAAGADFAADALPAVQPPPSLAGSETTASVESSMAIQVENTEATAPSLPVNAAGPSSPAFSSTHAITVSALAEVAGSGAVLAAANLANLPALLTLVTVAHAGQGFSDAIVPARGLIAPNDTIVITNKRDASDRVLTSAWLRTPAARDVDCFDSDQAAIDLNWRVLEEWRKARHKAETTSPAAPQQAAPDRAAVDLYFAQISEDTGDADEE
jgi:hypothetical protein